MCSITPLVVSSLQEVGWFLFVGRAVLASEGETRSDWHFWLYLWTLLGVHAYTAHWGDMSWSENMTWSVSSHHLNTAAVTFLPWALEGLWLPAFPWAWEKTLHLQCLMRETVPVRQNSQVQNKGSQGTLCCMYLLWQTVSNILLWL